MVCVPENSIYVLPFVLYQVFLRIAFKQPLAGRTAEVKVLPIQRAPMAGGSDFYHHTTYGIKGHTTVLFRLLVLHLLFRRHRLWQRIVMALMSGLHQFGQDTGTNFPGPNGAHVQTSGTSA